MPQKPCCKQWGPTGILKNMGILMVFNRSYCKNSIVCLKFHDLKISSRQVFQVFIVFHLEKLELLTPWLEIQHRHTKPVGEASSILQGSRCDLKDVTLMQWIHQEIKVFLVNLNFSLFQPAKDIKTSTRCSRHFECTLNISRDFEVFFFRFSNVFFFEEAR